MFGRLKQKIVEQANRSRAPPEYDAPVQKRIQLLEVIRELAAGIVADCVSLCKIFDQPEGPLRNVSENLAVNLKMMANAVKETDAEYSKFLLVLTEIYDEMGRAQRKLQVDLKEQIIDPFNAWLLTDYARMKREILSLHERKRDAEKSNDRLSKPNPSREHLVAAEQTRKEFERQMDVVKGELLKLTTIKNEHAGLFYNFLEILKVYHRSVVQIMEGKNVEKWNSVIR